MFEAAHHSRPAQFQDHLLQQGFQGGQLAARTLLSSLPSLASHAEISPTSATHGGEIIVDTTGAVISDGAMRFEGEIRELGSVVVMVFLNKSGLGSTLVKVGAGWVIYGALSFGAGAGAGDEAEIEESSDRVIEEPSDRETNDRADDIVQAGAVPTWSVYDQFWQGFSAAHELFTGTSTRVHLTPNH
jgi:hypothetical protein